MRCLLFIIICFGSSLIFALSEQEVAEVSQRIAPVGQVNIQQKAIAKKNVTLTQADFSVGQKIYEKYCIVCHQGGLAGAPKFRDLNDWALRTKNRSSSDLTESAINGLNAMPAKGTCNDCRDEELKAAIEYMLPKK